MGLMTSEILNVIIDERKRLSEIDGVALMSLGESFVASQATQRRVFKDYILSSEVFTLDHHLE
jgi:hypothetical protein